MSLTYALISILCAALAYILGVLTGRHYALISMRELERITRLLPASKAPRDAIAEATERTTTRIISPLAKARARSFDKEINA